MTTETKNEIVSEPRWEEDKHDQSNFEKKHGLRSRHDLLKYVLGQFEKLDEEDFHRMYDILGTLRTNQILSESDKSRIEALEGELVGLKNQLRQAGESEVCPRYGRCRCRNKCQMLERDIGFFSGKILTDFSGKVCETFKTDAISRGKYKALLS